MLVSSIEYVFDERKIKIWLHGYGHEKVSLSLLSVSVCDHVVTAIQDNMGTELVVTVFLCELLGARGGVNKNYPTYFSHHNPTITIVEGGICMELRVSQTESPCPSHQRPHTHIA